MKQVPVICSLLLGALPTGFGLPQALDLRQSGLSAACSQLAAAYPKSTFPQGTSEYTEESTENWSQTCLLQPGCVFEPATANEVAGGLKILRKTKTKFAVRSGGHMPVPGAANIVDGVLVALSSLRTLNMAGGTAQIGPGLTWAEVYNWTVSQGVAVTGGRFGPVGVGGLLTGGGINYLGSKYGWSATSVQNFQVVLANGTIVDANAKKNADLWWALKGGSNNFGIVTRFDFKTFPIASVFGGTIQYPPTALDDYLNAIGAFAAPTGGSADVEAHANPLMLMLPSTGQILPAVVLFHQGSDPAPASLKNFTSIPSLTDTTTVHPTFSDFMVEQSGGAFGDKSQRRLFYAFSVKAVPEAVRLVNSTFIPRAMKDLSGIPDALTSLTYQTISKNWLTAAKAAGGDAINLDPADGGLIAVLISTTWGNAADDATIKTFTESITEEIKTKAKAANLFHPYIFLNDAGAGQDVFGSYGKGTSLPRMKQIARSYDPCGVFQTLEPGGFKLGGASSAGSDC